MNEMDLAEELQKRSEALSRTGKNADAARMKQAAICITALAKSNTAYTAAFDIYDSRKWWQWLLYGKPSSKELR